MARQAIVLKSLTLEATLSADPRVKQAAYRLDAIRRHLEQSEKISVRRLKDFLEETRERTALIRNLATATLDEAEAQAYVDFVLSYCPIWWRVLDRLRR
jgi:hypothetical protein